MTWCSSTVTALYCGRHSTIDLHVFPWTLWIRSHQEETLWTAGNQDFCRPDDVLRDAHRQCTCSYGDSLSDSAQTIRSSAVPSRLLSCRHPYWQMPAVLDASDTESLCRCARQPPHLAAAASNHLTHITHTQYIHYSRQLHSLLTLSLLFLKANSSRAILYQGCRTCNQYSSSSSNVSVWTQV